MNQSHWVRNGLIVAVLAGIVSGCTTTNAYTGEKQVSKTTKGGHRRVGRRRCRRAHG